MIVLSKADETSAIPKSLSIAQTLKSFWERNARGKYDAHNTAFQKINLFLRPILPDSLQSTLQSTRNTPTLHLSATACDKFHIVVVSVRALHISTSFSVESLRYPLCTFSHFTLSFQGCTSLLLHTPYVLAYLVVAKAQTQCTLLAQVKQVLQNRVLLCLLFL